MGHLNECPESKSPNRDYIIGLMDGVDECYLDDDDSQCKISNDFDMDDMIELAKKMNEEEENES